MIDKDPAEGRSPFAYLASEQFILLKTFRKSGVAVGTQVWFAFDPDDDRKLYVVTNENTGKAKRLRNSPRVQLAPCDRRGNVHGPEIEASATFVPESGAARADATLAKRFGLFYRAIGLVAAIRRAPRIYLQIVPSGV